MIPASLLAFSRMQIARTFTDSCIISRKYVADPDATVDSVSDGMGGSLGGEAAGAVNGFVDDTNATACRLEYVPAGKGKGEQLSDGIQPFTNADVALPANTQVRDADRLILTEAATGLTRTWEIMSQAPHSEQFSMLVSVRIVGEDLGVSS